MLGKVSFKRRRLFFTIPALPEQILPFPPPGRVPQPRGQAASREGYFWLRQASCPWLLVPREKAIQYLQEHIWQRGSTINLPRFNTPCSRLVIAASSQSGSEQLLEAGVAPPSLLLHRFSSLLSGGPRHQTRDTARLGFRGPLSLGGQDFGASLMRLHIFFFPNSLFIFSRVIGLCSSDSFSKHTQSRLGDKTNQPREA